MATAEMVVNIRTRDISFRCGGQSVSFNVDAPGTSKVSDCLILEAPNTRKKRSRVFTLVQAFEGVKELNMGKQDCAKERQECELEEDESSSTFEEIGELEHDNKKLKLEVYLLKTENGMLKKKLQDFSTLNESLQKQVVDDRAKYVVYLGPQTNTRCSVSRAFRSILWGICALLQEYRSGRVYGGSG